MDSAKLYAVFLLLVMVNLRTPCAAAAVAQRTATQHGYGHNAPPKEHLNPATDNSILLNLQHMEFALPLNHQDPPLAFSAVCTETLDYFPGSTVVFNDVITNEGGAYINNTGQFACIDDSVYLFTWSVVKQVVEELPGMRVIAKLQMGLDDIKFGPKTTYYRPQNTAGNAEMSSIVGCRTSPVSAITVSIEPWMNNNAVKLISGYPGFSGFRLGSPDDTVAFVAELTNETYIFPGGVIRFQQVLQNYGGLYDPISGMFTCPDNYTYVFTVTTLTRDPETPWSVSRLMIEGDEIMLGPVTYRATEEYDSGSASVTAVTRCQLNKRIYVEAHQAGDFPFNSYAPRLTSFTGFRVHGEEVESVAFMAVLAENLTVIDIDIPIVMDKVVINIGGAYDSLTGSFFCPDDKLYMFSYTATSDEIIHGAIYMDGKLIRRNRTSTLDRSFNAATGSSTTSVIIRCQEGSRIHIMHTYGTDQIYLAEYTTFSGYKLPSQDM